MSTEQPVRYTHGHAESVLDSHRWRTAANSAAYLIPRLSPGATLLDVGCGPGTITLDLARLVTPGQVVGLDSSADVIEIARAAARDADLGSVAFETGDAGRDRAGHDRGAGRAGRGMADLGRCAERLVRCDP